ncbi:MAG: hypothetical protein COU06_00320 [Candidatus Harrisonbacteria bacterium CG10_big_fil_rev_8_21_14_0_10_38_8]|uniref:Penicillin-binding protein 2 n=1 Tax=Candidatus Harrisonbacteria bacterium CG10_big_fil_rev_8_21_14_0_10_38_8 TaxID=1974582 RepID=A0A2M6WKV4_9BACT|nr:MAG: hypothetical protein COU06_00320 [Candidatus Harrisonbacteria bacterium CG10_big_fil_rev_8_21_14_0_10_38_8]
MKFRLPLLLFLSSSTFLFIGYTIYNLQINQGEQYTLKAQAQSLTSYESGAERGSIYFTDKKGEKIPAAINKEISVIYLVPREVEDIQETKARILNQLIVDEAKLEESLNKVTDQYEEIKVGATNDEVKRIQAEEIKGVYIKNIRTRYYPFDSLAAHVLGFVGINKTTTKPQGLYGVESYYNRTLTGVTGIFSKSTDGKDITLTIDRVVQVEAEKMAEKIVKEFQAESADIIVQDPRTGKIIAMTSYPTFNPNEYQDSFVKNFINPSVQLQYEPGSAFKVLTMAAGIDSGAITPDTTYTDYGELTIDGRTIRNWDLKAHGLTTMTDVLGQSINTGTVFAQQKMGKEVFYKYIKDFGIKDLTNIDLPGESGGSIAPLEEEKRDINFATASYGQGISVTPIWLINAISAIANGGVLEQPYITNESKSYVSRRILEKETTDQVTKMMIDAVDGAHVAKIPNYSVAGKTGTAYIPNFESGGYTDEVINTYVGFAPATRPEFTILIKLTKPQTQKLAGQTVVPAFRVLAQTLLTYYNSHPDRIE